jgi:hypothetical protein
VLHVGEWGGPALLGACYKVGFWYLFFLGCSESCRDLVACWQGCFWRVVHHFEDCERTILALSCYFFQSLFAWVVAAGLFSISSLVESIALCTFVVLFIIP